MINHSNNNKRKKRIKSTSIGFLLARNKEMIIMNDPAINSFNDNFVFYDRNYDFILNEIFFFFQLQSDNDCGGKHDLDKLNQCLARFYAAIFSKF